MRTAHSSVVALACLYLIMVVAGCTTIPVETVKQAIDKRRQEQCVCEPAQPPVTIIIMED
jgi:hypothetical protein